MHCCTSAKTVMRRYNPCNISKVFIKRWGYLHIPKKYLHIPQTPIHLSLLKTYENTSLIFFERQIWIIDGPLEYYRATSRTTQSYPSPLGNNAHTPIREETQ
ncbi:hypothetical protein Hanom_Chr00s003213g01710671 [Helianthus anomalus]